LTRRWLLTLVAGLLALAAGRPARADKELVVFAAASLKEAFGDLAAAFEKAHPGVKVRVNLAGSQEVRTQIEQGATADVLASADLEHMAALEKAALVRPSAVFARNEPVIVVPAANPAAIHTLGDLPRTRRLVIGAPEVPIGRYTVKIFEAAGKKLGPEFRSRLEAAVVSRELNVRQVLAKVTLGEADAGIVYRTDARAAGDKVAVVPIPPDLNVVASYPIAAVSASKQPALAEALVALARSAEGQRRLVAAGFLPAAPGRSGTADGVPGH
jgi:molybdate transport system substrate-binding protein